MVLQRLKELDLGQKEQKFNHKNPFSSKHNDYLNECLMKSETRVGRMRTGDAHRQRHKNIKNFLQQLTIFPQNQFSFRSTISKKLKFLLSFDSFKSMKLRAMRSKMTKDTTMVTNNVFRSTRLFGNGSSNMVLFSF